MVILTNIIWISSNENNNKIKNYLKELGDSKLYKINLLFSIEEAINLYISFIEQFQKNIIIPKIIIFTDNKEEFMNKNIEYKKIINHPFYNSGGVKTNLNEIEEFILNPICKKKVLLNIDEDKNLSFEYIDSKEKLLLPMFYKTLMEIEPNDNIEKFTYSLCNDYKNKSTNLDNILNSLKSLSDIPIELLSKFYARIYTDQDSQFYNEMNTNLRENKKNNYLAFIKVLYEGCRLQSFTNIK